MSLLERLCHDADDLPYLSDPYRSVVAHLYQIINARAPVWPGQKPAVRAGGITTFGLSHLLRSQGKFHLTVIIKEIEVLIRRYEPRLQQVTVCTGFQAYQQHQVSFEITAQLIDALGGGELSLQACLDFNTGQMISSGNGHA